MLGAINEDEAIFQMKINGSCRRLLSIEVTRNSLLCGERSLNLPDENYGLRALALVGTHAHTHAPQTGC